MNAALDLTVLCTITFFGRKNAVLDLAVLYTITVFCRENAVFYLAVLYTITLFETFLDQRLLLIVNTFRILGAKMRGPQNVITNGIL